MKTYEFYLGTHVVKWLEFIDKPLFISRRQLFKRRSFPRAVGKWALDSGGFSELSMFGEWTVGYKQYAREVKLFSEEIGNLQFASIMDWMCEPWIIKETGLTIKKHQIKTVSNYLRLISYKPEIPWLPVIQGYTISDYLNCIELYEKHGVDLNKLDRVGIGSVCRRQSSSEILNIVKPIAEFGIKLHGFGVKKTGIMLAAKYFKSTDSMAWSYGARMQPPLPGCVGHKNCANCFRFALIWRKEIIKVIKKYRNNEPFTKIFSK